jgi:hypothetical protein
MRPGIAFVAIVLLVIVLPSVGGLRAEWIPNGAAVISYTGTQQGVHMAPDGEGGAFVVWQEQRNTISDIYAQRIDRYGNKLWQADGVPVCTASDWQYAPRVVADGSGGAIVTWYDYRSTTSNDIYAQRLDGGGTASWTPNGVAICTSTGNQIYPDLIPDGSGGAVIIWQDQRSGNWDIYMQRVDADGDIIWVVNGNTVCNATLDQTAPEIIADGSGGVIVTWQDYRNGSHYDIYAARFLIDSSGSMMWTFNGNAICSSLRNQEYPELIPDGSGGAIITWQDFLSNVTYDIRAQRVNISGAIQWISTGAGVCAESGSQLYPVIAPDGSGGAVITWHDYRTTDANIYANRLDAEGRLLWQSSGIAVCTASYNQDYPVIVGDGLGGAFITWEDRRTNADYQMYLQFVHPDGSITWTTDGVELCALGGNQNNPAVITDGMGGVLVAWQDGRTNNDGDIYAQRIEPRYGQWGHPEPVISAVEDVPADEGGVATVSWKPSQLDEFNYQTVTHYSVWRALDPVGAALTAASDDWPLLDEIGSAEGADPVFTAASNPTLPAATDSKVRLVQLSDISKDFEGPAIRLEQTAAGDFYWEWIGNVEAYYLPGYMHAASTLYDSTGTDPATHYFQVITHTEDRWVFWPSEPDSGYSVDNLAPCPPLGVVAEQLIVPAGLEITWEPNTESDLGGYVIYRGESSDFVPDEGTLFATTCDTLCFDDEWRWDSGYWYKLAAIDVHGNVSGFVLIGPEMVTGGDEPEAPIASYLSQNYPNPFNPLTTIAFGLKARSLVSLRIYDAAGRLVRVLVNEPRDAGRYVEEWNGRDNAGRSVSSGVYFYKLSAGAFTETKKMVLLR